ncbi:conserved hypothetical protein [Ricinus communis]|uniref:Uncharacterized protein n=1 Tax=Ricinus communis TaxID=3988 RepID=B9S8I5_RICCO|nr:conserved hypothetical protein [Ricinus communis]
MAKIQALYIIVLVSSSIICHAIMPAQGREITSEKKHTSAIRNDRAMYKDGTEPTNPCFSSMPEEVDKDAFLPPKTGSSPGIGH